MNFSLLLSKMSSKQLLFPLQEKIYAEKLFVVDIVLATSSSYAEL